MKIVTQALSALLNAKTVSDVLLNVVNQDETSDTDTVCAIAGIMASRCADLEDDLPASLRNGLENGPYGASYLQKIDSAVASAFPRKELYVLNVSGHGHL